MAKTDDQMNRAIRLLAGHEVESEEDDKQEQKQLVYVQDVKSDADVNAWLRRKAGR